MLTIVGAGSVGITLASYLATAGKPVRLYVRPKDRAGFEAAGGLTLALPSGGSLQAPLPVLTEHLVDADTRYLLVATKFGALDGLMAEVKTHLGHAGEGLTVISTLNGVRALPRIRELLPNAQAVALTIMFNAQHPRPLHAQLTTKPAVILSGTDVRLRALLKNTGLRLSTARGEEACWGKLLINLANAIGALTHSTFRDLLSHADLRAVFVAALDEAVDRLHAAKIAYQLPMPVPYPGYRWLLLHGGPLPWKLAQLRNGLADGAYPSMVRDVRAGRPTEVRQLNGEIVGLGQQLEWPAPVNAKLVALVEGLSLTATPAFTPTGLRAAVLGQSL